MSIVRTTVVINTFANAYANMPGFVCPNTALKLTADYLGLDFAEGKEHEGIVGRLRC